MNLQLYNVGPTSELKLRVSVATLSRVIFPRPVDQVPMLALEHKATLHPEGDEPQVEVIAQPFGGAVRILNLEGFSAHVGDFNFDSLRSRSEGDFRVYVRLSKWESLKEYCLRELARGDRSDLECDPSRELLEEFDDTLKIHLKPDQYTTGRVSIFLENEPAPTDNLHAAGNPTVRIYQVYEIQVHDPDLWRMMLTNSQAHSSRVLRRLAQQDAQNGGRGRANAILAAPIEEIRRTYLGIPPGERGLRLPFKDTLLAGNVAAVLEGVSVPKYRRLD